MPIKGPIIADAETVLNLGSGERAQSQSVLFFLNASTPLTYTVQRDCWVTYVLGPAGGLVWKGGSNGPGTPQQGTITANNLIFFGATPAGTSFGFPVSVKMLATEQITGYSPTAADKIVVVLEFVT